MSERDDVKAALRKASFAATTLKMDLHDLAEDLPLGWEGILDTAQRTYDAYARIQELERKLAELPEA